MLRLRDIAEGLSLSESTVSRALADHPRIPETTRARVKAAAARLGYLPDPALRRLAQMRWQGRHAERAASLALLRWSREDYPPIVGQVSVQLKETAHSLGYGFEEAVVQRFTSAAAAGRSLRARGVAGVLAMASTCDDAWQGFPWEHFAGVQLLSGSGRDSGLPCVRPDAFGTLLEAGRRVEVAGPGTAAIALFRQKHPSLTDERDEAAAGLVLQRWRAAGIKALPLAWFDANGNPDLASAVVDWLQQARPGVAVLPNTLIDAWLQQGHASLPPDIRIIACRRLGSPLFAGYEVRHDLIVRIAVRVLDGLIRSSNTGLPAVPESIVVPCEWHDGPSFPNPWPRASACGT